MTTIDELAQLGTSTWLDDLSRDRLESGNLKELISTKSIVGVTTNPAIFATAMTQGTAYDDDFAQLKAERAKADEAVYSLAIDDVRNACDVFQETLDRKSTRLNSSHVAISYAVFCLKKKKQHQHKHYIK